MRVQLEYNDDGEIRSVAGVAAVDFPDGSRGTMQRIARPGHRVIEVEVEEIQHDRDFDGVRRLIEEYRVSGHPHEPKLERR